MPYKQIQAEICLYPCNNERELQKWDFRNATLSVQGEDLFLSAGKRKEQNFLLSTGSVMMN